MPTYYSVRSSQTLELRRGSYGKVVDPIMGAQDAVFKPLKVYFTPLDKQTAVYGLPGRNGLAKGILTPEDGALQIRTAAAELGPIADNLPKTDEELADWLVQTLRKHGGNGSLFVEVADLDEVVDGEPMDENLSSPAVATLAAPVGLIVKQSNGRAYCRICDRTMGAQGVNGHSKSNKHLAKLKAYEAQMREAATG